MLTLTSPAMAQSARSPEQAVQIALDRHGDGKVLGVRTRQSDDGRDYFEVKILSNGEVRLYRIDKE